MYDLEMNLSFIAAKYGKEPFEDKEKLLELLKKDVVMFDVDRDLVQSLYDLGLAERLLEAPLDEQAKELELCYPILADSYSDPSQYLQKKKPAIALATFAGAVGFPKENIEAFAEKHRLKISPLYGDNGVWSQQKGLEMLPIWENYTKGIRYSEEGNTDMAIMMWEKGAEEGDVASLVCLASAFQNKFEFNKAKKYYLKAIKLGEPMAMLALGFLEDEVFRNYAEAEKLYRLYAQEDEEDGLILLGQLMTKQGKYNKAGNFLLKAAKLGDAEAMFNLGLLYKQNFNNDEKAVKWLKRAYKAGVEIAACTLCNLYSSLGDYKQAEQWGLRAVKMDGDDKYDAMNELGILYKDHLNQPKKAFKWFKKAIDEGNNYEALCNIGNLLRDDLKDYKLAEKYYLKAAKAGDVDSIGDLGVLYNECLDDQKTALKWFKKAIALGNERALHNLGMMYFQHEEYDKAKKWFLKGAKAGRADSMNNLGHIYMNVYNNPSKAMKWFSKATEAGNFKAYNNMGVICEYIYHDYDKAEEYFKKALAHGCDEARINLLALQATQNESNDKGFGRFFKKNSKNRTRKKKGK